MTDAEQARFRALYTANFRDLLTFALRRCEEPEDASDVVADTFLVAWRRIDEVPLGQEGRLWLYGVCRRTVANHSRGDQRRNRLGARLRSTLQAVYEPDHAGTVETSVAMRQAMARLRPMDREVLELTAWEGLEPVEIALVLDLPARTVRTRLSRARCRLRQLLSGDASPPAGHVEEDPGAERPQPLSLTKETR